MNGKRKSRNGGMGWIDDRNAQDIVTDSVVSE